MTNKSCQWCSFRQACRYGDSAERRRLIHALELKTAFKEPKDNMSEASLGAHTDLNDAVQDMIWQIGKN